MRRREEHRVVVNKLCHFEIGVRDQAKAEKFYGNVFDWKMEPQPNMTMIRTGDDVGGHFNTLGHEPHNYVLFYVMVDDVAATIKKVEAAGGKKIVGPVPEGEGNVFAWVADPEGNVIGIYTERKK